MSPQNYLIAIHPQNLLANIFYQTNSPMSSLNIIKALVDFKSLQSLIQFWDSIKLQSIGCWAGSNSITWD